MDATVPSATTASDAGVPVGFQTTRWSRVLRAGAADSDVGDPALAELCAAYWDPLYAFVRRSGHAPEDARDLTQEFFTRLIEKKWLTEAHPARGRFRSFLLAALEHFLANEWHRSQARKRGGDAVAFSRDTLDPEERYALEPVDPATPETLYERRWAETLLDRALLRLAEEYGIHALGWATLHRFGVETRGEVNLLETARALEGTKSALRSGVHRLRRRYQESARLEVRKPSMDRRRWTVNSGPCFPCSSGRPLRADNRSPGLRLSERTLRAPGSPVVACVQAGRILARLLRRSFSKG